MTFARHKNQSGQALAEVALILPILLLVVCGALEVGQVLHLSLAVDHSSREGARLGALGSTDTEIIACVLGQLPSTDPSRLEVTIMPGPTGRIRGAPLSVTVRYPHRFITPLVGAMLGGEFWVTGRTTMRIE